MRLSVEEVPATPAMASMLMVIHLLQRSVLRRPDTETCAVRSAHASREVLDRSLSCGRSVDAIGAPQRLRCQLPHIGASGAPAASNEACWCATATPTGQSKPTVRETPFFHTVPVTERARWRPERQRNRAHWAICRKSSPISELSRLILSN